MGNEVDSDGSYADLNDPAWVHQIGGGVACIGSPKEVLQSGQDAPGVGAGWIQQNIKVFRGAWTGVKGHGVSADDEITYSTMI